MGEDQLDDLELDGPITLSSLNDRWGLHPSEIMEVMEDREVRRLNLELLPPQPSGKRKRAMKKEEEEASRSDWQICPNELADTVHAVIEKQKKITKALIEVRRDWITAIRSIPRNKNLKVFEMEQRDFKSFKFFPKVHWSIEEKLKM